MSIRRHFNGDKDGSEPSKRRQKFQLRAFPRLVSEVAIEKFWEPLVRRVVKEEVARALPSIHPCPSSSGVRSLHLRFVNALPSFVFTKNSIKAEDGTPISIQLLDTSSGAIVKAGPLSTLKLDTLVLDGDFPFDDHEDWTEQDFNASVLREREGKRPLLVGVLKVTLNEGVGCIGNIQFTDNSRWTRSGKFRLGTKVDQKFCGEVKIREATSRKFAVKDQRGESNRKHETPSLEDPIWRLKKIRRCGPNYKNLTSSGIRTVKDLLVQNVINPSYLRSLFVKRVSDKIWKEIVENAMASVANDHKLYAYHKAGERVGLRFNSSFKVVAATFDGQNYCSVQTLSLDEKHAVEVVKQQAYENLDDWVLVNELSTVSPSRSSRSLHDHPYSALEQSPKQLEFPPPVTLQDQEQIWLNFNHSYPPYSASHVHGETSNRIEASEPQSNLLIPSNGLTDDLSRYYNEDVQVFPNGSYTGIIARTPPWMHENEPFIFPSNQADFGDFNFFNSGVPILRPGKAAWCKIRAAVKWSTVRRDVAAKKMAARPMISI